MIAIRKRWFADTYDLKSTEGTDIGELRISSLRGQGSAVFRGQRYAVHRVGLFGPHVMETLDGSRVASATQPNVFRSKYLINGTGGSFVLRAPGFFSQRFDVHRDDEHVGTIAPTSWLSRHGTARFADDVPPALQAFLIWLALREWMSDTGG